MSPNTGWIGSALLAVLCGMLPAQASSATYLVNTQQAPFGFPSPSWSPARPGLIGDFNNNGYPDILYHDWWNQQFFFRPDPGLNGLPGTFIQHLAPYGTPVAGFGITAGAAADIDADGNLDLVAIIRGDTGAGMTSSLFTIRGDGTGGFPQAPGPPLPFTDLADWLAVSDVTGDGLPDIIVERRNPATQAFRLSVLVNTSTAWVLAGELPLVAHGSAPQVGDFDGDGMQDLLWQYGSGAGTGIPSDALFVAYGNGNGTFQAPVIHQVGLPTTWPYASAYGYRAADVDGDGICDIATFVMRAYFIHEVRVLYGQADRSMTPGVVSGPATGYGVLLELSVHDFTGDGVNDILFEEPYQVNELIFVRIRLIPGLGNRQFATTTMNSQSNPLRPGALQLRVGDLDRDNDLDLFAISGGPPRDYIFDNVSIASLGSGGVNGPIAFPIGTATPGNAAFALSLTGAPANSPAVLGIGAGRLTVPLAPFELLLDLAAPTAFIPQMTDGSGSAQIGIPIPWTPYLHGVTFYGQWAVSDPGGIPAGAFNLSLSPGRTIIVW